MQTIIIVAMTPDRLIGKGGALPWYEPEDLKHFKQTTMGHAVIMGRKTFDSIQKPLSGRRNIIITRHPSFAPNGKYPPNTTLDVVHSLDEAIALSRSRQEDKVFIAGGAQIYKQALSVADEMIITFIEKPGLTGDTYFPQWPAADWEEVPETQKGPLHIVRYHRRA